MALGEEGGGGSYRGDNIKRAELLEESMSWLEGYHVRVRSGGDFCKNSK